MKEQIKVTFLIDKEKYMNATAKLAAEQENAENILTHISMSSLILHNNEQINTVDLSAINNTDLFKGFLIMAFAFVSEQIKINGEDWFKSVMFGKEQK